MSETERRSGRTENSGHRRGEARDTSATSGDHGNSNTPAQPEGSLEKRHTESELDPDRSPRVDRVLSSLIGVTSLFLKRHTESETDPDRKPPRTIISTGIYLKRHTESETDPDRKPIRRALGRRLRAKRHTESETDPDRRPPSSRAYLPRAPMPRLEMKRHDESETDPDRQSQPQGRYLYV